MEDKENLGIRDNKNLLPIVIIQGIVILVLIIFVVVVSDIPDDQVIDYNRIEEIVDKKLGVIDLAASVLCMENKVPMLIFGLNEKDSIINTVTGKFTGTKIIV